MICREAIQGATKSFYCSTDGQHVDDDSPAPLGCAIPLATAAILCNLAVVGGLVCVGRFAWQSGGAANGDVELQRASLIADLRVWRSFSAKAVWVQDANRLAHVSHGSSSQGHPRPNQMRGVVAFAWW